VTDAADVEKFFAAMLRERPPFAKRGSLWWAISSRGICVCGCLHASPRWRRRVDDAMLMQNTVTAAKLRRGLPAEKVSEKLQEKN